MINLRMSSKMKGVQMGKLKMKCKKVFCRVLPLLAALVLILGSCLTVSAATTTSEPLDSSVENIIYSYLNQNYSSYEWKYILYLGDVAYVSTDAMYSDGTNFYIKNDSVNRKLYFSGNTITKSISTSTNSNNSIIDNTSLFLTCGSGTIYINNDITDGHGNVVFQLPVVPILQEAAQGIVPEEVMKETIGLLPLLIPFLVGLVGFWKGWQFLLQILRKA